MKVFSKTLIIVILISIIIKIISSNVRRTSISIKSVSFDHSDGNLLKLGTKDICIPSMGDGIYAVSLRRTFSGVKSNIMYIGVLKINTFQEQIHKIDHFFKKTMNNSSHIALFSIGTTHEKPVLEILRTGISIGSLDDILHIFKTYGITKFTSFSHGVRKPYIFIKNTYNGNVIERTGNSGGKLIANL